MTNIKQVHIGLGRFFRGHQAVYTQHVTKGDEWPIAAVSLRTREAVDQMKKQDGKYHVVSNDQENSKIEVIDVISKCLFLEDEYQEIVNLLSSESVEIISFTITEKGYCFDFSNQALDLENPEIKEDLKGSSIPKTSIGLVAESLIKRFNGHKKPVTLLSCDNVSMNGDVLGKVVKQFLEIKHPGAMTWFDKSIKCPNTMVDRIVPRINNSELESVADQLSFVDKIPIITEKFTQWCIEDNFSSKRPHWEKDGVQFVENIEPFENLKLRALNASHSYLTYLGLLKGYKYVHEAIADEEIEGDIKNLFRNEVAPTIKEIAEETFTKYCQSLIERFRNPHLKHELIQIAMDGSQKIPQRWVPSIEYLLGKNLKVTILFRALAYWTVFIESQVRSKTKIDDPKSELLETTFAKIENISELKRALAKVNIVPSSILENPAFNEEFDEQCRRFFQKD